MSMYKNALDMHFPAMEQFKDIFDGADYVPKRDDIRLTGQIKRVFNVMKDGQKRTLRQISGVTGDPEASVSAQLRHLKKDRFGAYRVEKEFIGNGLYLYWVLPPLTTGQQELL